MAVDGIFMHYLCDELQQKLVNGKINKIYQPNPFDVVMLVRSNAGSFQLLLSAALDSPRLYLTEQKIVNKLVPGNFCMLLRKYIERGVIKDISQYQNDRLCKIKINTFNELGDNVDYILIMELMGRNSNIILLNEEGTIIDSIRKLPPSETNTRLIIPRAHYIYPFQENAVNPFTVEQIMPNDFLQGVSNPSKNEINDYFNGDVKAFINQPVVPSIYTGMRRPEFYCFKMNSFLNETGDNFQVFDSLSTMLDYYYNKSNQTINYDNSALLKQVKRLLNHQTTKLDNLHGDLELAKKNVHYTDLGILLQANLYLVKKGMASITVNNYLNNNEPVEIPLQTDLDPSKNLQRLFSKGKKAKTALTEVAKQIKITLQEIDYLEEIMTMIQYANTSELLEIKQELLQNGELSKQSKNPRKVPKVTLTSIVVDDVTIWIGKNNLQNDHLTHKIAHSNDYWFHVNNAPGAHVVVSVPRNSDDYVMSEKIIRLASNFAAYYSKMSSSSSVPVDYTKVRYLKKIPGMKGYKVTYTNQKTIYIDPDYQIIQQFIHK